MIHEFDGHGMSVPGEERSGEEIMADQLSALYAQHGVEMASDDSTGAWLDPNLVREGGAVEMKFFKDMGVYDCGKIIGTKWIDVNKGDFDNP